MVVHSGSSVFLVRLVIMVYGS